MLFSTLSYGYEEIKASATMYTASDFEVHVRSAANIPLSAALPAFNALLCDLDRRTEPTELSVNLAADLQMPLEGTLEVPVSIIALYLQDERHCHIRLGALAQHDYYPHFEGVLSIAEGGSETSVLHLDGAYTVPFGAIGKWADVTLLRGVTASSLQRFTDRLADEILRRTGQ